MPGLRRRPIQITTGRLPCPKRSPPHSLFSWLLRLPLQAGAAAEGNPEIAALQVGLRHKGLYVGTVDGVLGPGTETALRRFQRRARLSADGVPGPRTRKALGRFGRRAPLGRRPLTLGQARVGCCRPPVRARLARLSLGHLRRLSRFAHRRGAARLSGVGRNQARWDDGTRDNRGTAGTAAALAAEICASAARAARRTLRAPRSPVSRGCRLPRPARNCGCCGRLRPSRIRRAERQCLGKPRRRRPPSRRSYAIRAPLSHRRPGRSARSRGLDGWFRRRDRRSDRAASPFRSRSPLLFERSISLAAF